LKAVLERFFKLSEHNTTIRREFTGGMVTFLTMSYIIFLQPAILHQAHMDFNSVMMATCLASALATLIMGFYANYPIGLAPGMGENFFFAFTVVLMLGVSWQQALGIVFISGVAFVILTVLKVREKFIDSIPASLKSAIAAGIGALIGFIGLVNSGIIIRNNSPLKAIAYGQDIKPETIAKKLDTFEYSAGALKLGDFSNPATLVAVIGLFIIVALLVKKIKGSMLWGILLTALVGMMFGVVKWQGVVSAPPSIKPTFLQLSFENVFTLDMLPIILVFFIMDFFDTIGTLIGVSSRAGLLKNNKLPRASRALMADALGTVSGALLGTSTVTSYIESTAGVEEGSRTGLASVVTGFLFLLAVFFSPLVRMIGGGYAYSLENKIFLYPITAPVLIVVAALMLKEVTKIQWDDYSESIPAFLTVIGMPLTGSIADGLAFGFISFTIIKFITGKWRDINVILIVITILFLVRFIFLKL